MPDEPSRPPAVLEGTVVDRLANIRRRPVVPVWIRDDVTRRAAVKYAFLHGGHVIVWEVTRTPKYLLRAVVWCPRGLARTVARTAGWALDIETQRHKSLLVAQGDTDSWLKVERQTEGRVRGRLAALGAAVLPAAMGVSALVQFAPLPGQLAAAGAAVAAFGYLGRPAGRPFFDAPLIGTRAEKPVPDAITHALASLGLAGINQALAKDPKAIRYVAPGVGRDGPGWRADLDLPHGVTVAEVLDRRDKFASGLRRPLGCVWPEGDDTEHPGRMVLFIGDRDMAKTGRLTWPLARSGQSDVFAPLPFGVDPRGRPVRVKLMYGNLLLGSIPRQGKTAAVRVLACGSALDPRDELWIHELKGTGDLDPLERVCHRFVSGVHDEAVGYAAESLALLRAEVVARTERFRRIPRDLVPDKRITPEVAAKRSLGMWPLTCVIDECQNLFGHGVYGRQAGEDAEFVIRIGPAMGVKLVLATQRPDKDALPTGISANVSIRFCLKVMGQVENDMILGTSAYKNGLKATTFRPEIDAGIGLLVGAGPAPVVCKTYYLDTAAAERVALRARALREAAGTITGHAAGEGPETAAAVSLLEDVAAVMHGEDRLWSEVICARLAELRPGMYAGWDAAQLGRALAAYRIVSVQTWGRDGEGQGRNRQGIERKAVLAVLDGRGT